MHADGDCWYVRLAAGRAGVGGMEVRVKGGRNGVWVPMGGERRRRSAEVLTG
jgi:hypothetical protein